MALDAQIAFRTSSDVKALLEKIAVSQNKKFSQLLNEIVVDYVNKNKDKEILSLAAILQKLEEHEQLIAQLQQAQVEILEQLKA